MPSLERDRTVTEELLIDASPETVFACFVDPDQMRKWMGGHVILEPSPGGLFAVDIADNRVRGSFLEVRAPQRIVFTWGWEGSDSVPPGSSTVTFIFERQGAGTLLRMVHEGLPKGEDLKHQHGWTHYFSRLTLAARGLDPGPDPHAESSDTPLHETSS